MFPFSMRFGNKLVYTNTVRGCCRYSTVLNYTAMVTVKYTRVTAIMEIQNVYTSYFLRCYTFHFVTRNILHVIDSQYSLYYLQLNDIIRRDCGLLKLAIC